VGLVLEEISVDGCITKAPGGGECAGPSPVDRRKQVLRITDRHIGGEGHLDAVAVGAIAVAEWGKSLVSR
jgi:hypothetical protein